MGSVRARLDRLDEPSSNKVLPITIHGDAAVTGQGVVQETLNMSKARGYEVGGTVRIVINNQVGFTTSNPLDARSTPYCTDIGKMVQAPIFHVNADDPEAVAFVTRVALDFRNTFKRDVFIDLVCYRRHGHNEADEPSATQPLMYQKIKKHPTPRKIYADKLEHDGVATLEDATELVNLYRDALDAGECVVKEWRPMNMHSFTWSPYLNHEWDESYPNKVEMKRLQELAKRISTVPESIEMQARVAKIYNDRQAMAQARNCSTGAARKTWPMRRWLTKVSPCVCPVKILVAARSSIVTRLSTTRRTVQPTHRCITSIMRRAVQSLGLRTV
jgi:2-oxoglutarate dehydrogenase E1 component